MISNEYGSVGKGNILGTFVKDTTPVAELTATPSTVPVTTDSMILSLLASVTVSVCRLEYVCPASTASVTSAFCMAGAKLAVINIKTLIIIVYHMTTLLCSG